MRVCVLLLLLFYYYYYYYYYYWYYILPGIYIYMIYNAHKELEARARASVKMALNLSSTPVARSTVDPHAPPRPRRAVHTAAAATCPCVRRRRRRRRRVNSRRPDGVFVCVRLCRVVGGRRLPVGAPPPLMSLTCRTRCVCV